MIEIEVRDPSNFGEVFACLGLFELAELYCFSVGGFKEDEGKLKFFLETKMELRDLLEKLKNARISSIGMRDLAEREWPIEIEVDPEHKIVLNWWLDPLLRDRKSLLKLWGGRKHLWIEGSKRESYLAGYQEKINVERALSEGLFYRQELISLGFDVHGSWSRSTAGYSYDDMEVKPYVSPLCEILSTIALQSFRPRENLEERYIEYYLWTSRLPHSAARVAISGGWREKSLTIAGRVWRAYVEEKGQGYRRLTPAQPI